MVTKEWITFYLNRHEVFRIKTPKEHRRPLHVLLNLALGSGWPIDRTPDPSFMYVDYVRVYKMIGE
jgi:beta-glucanase (GH16 family)